LTNPIAMTQDIASLGFLSEKRFNFVLEPMLKVTNYIFLRHVVTLPSRIYLWYQSYASLLGYKNNLSTKQSYRNWQGQKFKPQEQRKENEKERREYCCDDFRQC